MTIRRPAAFIAARSRTDTGRGSAFIGVQFRQLSPPEVASGQPGMGNDKVAVANTPGAELDDVEIEGSRSPPFGSNAPGGPLDGLTCLEQRVGLEAGLEHDHLVQVGRLLFATERNGFFDRRHSEQAGLWEG